MIVAVHRYEGTVNQVMGDGIMALFGAPIAHEDHAVRACYIALATQDAIRPYNEEARRLHSIEVQIRVRLNSGEVVVRSIGNDLHMDYSNIGQATHLAVLMEQLATPGSIRLTAATLRLAPDEASSCVTRRGGVAMSLPLPMRLPQPSPRRLGAPYSPPRSRQASHGLQLDSGPASRQGLPLRTYGNTFQSGKSLASVCC